MSDKVTCCFCGGECLISGSLRWCCQNAGCHASGPHSDPTGDKFMSLNVAIEVKDKRIAELEEKNLDLTERLTTYEQMIDLECGEVPLTKTKKEKRDERLRVAAGILICVLENSIDTIDADIKASLEFADMLIAAVDR